MLFCDVVDYTQRSSSMDPEDLAEEIRGFQTRCETIDKQHGGHITSFLGDGLMMVFGYPAPDEFGAENAIRSGARILDSVFENHPNDKQKDHSPISVRIGIATSLVLIGERAGLHQERDELIFGEAPNLANRLQQTAKPNSILLSAGTRLLTHDTFNLQDIGEHKLKGFPQPVPIWSFIGEKSLEQKKDQLKRNRIDSVGREKELSVLLNTLESACAGKPQILFLSGDAGTGKTRLLDDYEQMLEKRGERILKIDIRYPSPHRRISLAPVVDTLESLFGIQLTSGVRTKCRIVSNAMGLLGFHHDDDINLVCQLMAWYSMGNSSEESPLQGKSTDGGLSLITRILCRLSLELPLFVRVDDFQPTDTFILHCINLLHNLESRHRIFIVLVSRFKSYTDSLLHQLPELTLENLGPSDADIFMDAIFRRYPLPETIKHYIMQKSAGNPGFMIAMSRSLFEPPPSTVHYFREEDEVPSTLRYSLDAQINLSPNANSLLELVAVFGLCCYQSDLKTIADENNIEFQSGMDQLLNRRLLIMLEEDGDKKYVFRQPLVRLTCYQTLLRKRRRHYHQQIAQLFLSRRPDIVTTHPSWLAHQLEHLNLNSVAIDLWLRSSNLWILQNSLSEALDATFRAMVLYQRLNTNQDKTLFRLKLVNAIHLIIARRSNQTPDTITQRCHELLSILDSKKHPRWSTDDIFQVLLGQDEPPAYLMTSE